MSSHFWRVSRMQRNQHVAAVQRYNHLEIPIPFDGDDLGCMDSVTVCKSPSLIISVMPPDDPEAKTVKEVGTCEIGRHGLTKVMEGGSLKSKSILAG